MTDGKDQKSKQVRVKKTRAKSGARTKYHDLLPRIALTLESELKPTDVELAQILGVCEATIHNWKKSYPEFLESIKTGKRAANQIVKHALFKRAVGFSVPKAIYATKDGKITDIQEIEEYFPPDTSAIKTWLLNCDSENWRDDSAGLIDSLIQALTNRQGGTDESQSK